MSISRYRVRLFCVLVLCGITVVAPRFLHAQTFNVIHDFTGGVEGALPNTVVIDTAGNLYGTADGAETGEGYDTAFKLSQQGGHWIYSTLFTFPHENRYSGVYPQGLTLASSGAIYGVTAYGGFYGTNCGTTGCGTIYDRQQS
jgi:hypothetical protein